MLQFFLILARIFWNIPEVGIYSFMYQKFEELAPEQISQLIKDALFFLKREGITQSEVAARIEFDSLAKAKNFGRYQNKNSSLIGGKKLEDILTSICQSYGIAYDWELQQFKISKQDQMLTSAKEKVLAEYIYHYHTLTTGKVNKGIISFFKNKVELTIIAPGYPDLRDKWEGTYLFVGAYLILNFVKDDGISHLRSQHIYYTGLARVWQTIYLGTYVGIKMDGSPIAGKAILKKEGDTQAIEASIQQVADSRITRYLKDSMVQTSKDLVLSLDHLPA